ncbi:Formate hydrogenlyase regulatory protein HycA [Klebsiella pneumoniae subsp. rhinoscleromatis]|nr:Formate hydrogenlyase regulatory protein HycA [Klebsiella pneumoniae subsp. rhinoscleromatis]
MLRRNRYDYLGISEKADYIADRHRQQQEQWHIYCNSLVQGITLSKAACITR